MLIMGGSCLPSSSDEHTACRPLWQCYAVPSCYHALKHRPIPISSLAPATSVSGLLNRALPLPGMQCAKLLAAEAVCGPDSP